MENNFWIALGFSVAAASVTSIGIYVIRRFEAWGRNNITYFMCFAAGVLISASFLHIIPKAFSMTQQAPAFVLAGYLGLHLFNRFLTAFVCEKDPDKSEFGIGLTPALGIGFHSFIDGIIYSIAFSVSAFTGFLSTAGMVLHEFPEGIITYLLLIKGGFSERVAFRLALVTAAFSTPLGTLLSYPLISRIDTQTLGALLSISAGALIYVGATHLLPRAGQEPKKYSLVALSGGVLVAAIIVLSKG